MMRTKSVPVRIKAAGEHEGTEDGVFEAIVAAYNVDSVGDKITPGAFTKTLAEWTIKGDPIPVIWSHQWGDPDSHIGVVEDAKETEDGLWIKARLDLDEPKAAKVYKLLKGRRVTQFSFGYEIPKGGGEWVEGKSDDDPGYYALNEIKLFEVGPCLVGANQATSLESVKTSPGSGLTEERVREIAAAAVAEALAAKSAESDVAEPIVAEPDPVEAGPEPAQDQPATEVEDIPDPTVQLLTALTEQVKALADQISQQNTAPAASAATDDDPGQGKSAAPEDAATVDLRAALEELAALT